MQLRPLSVSPIAVLAILAAGALTSALAGCGGAASSGTVAPAVSLSPAGPLTFTSEVGATSAAQSVVVTNTGNAALTLTVSIGGANPGDFALASTCGSSLAAGSNCSISVAFAPASAASFTAVLSIADNASGSPQAVTLDGTGTAAPAPVVSLSATGPLDFTAAVGTTSAAQSVVVTNTGNAALTLSGISIGGANPGDFALASTCGSSLAAGSNCSISVTFAPASAASFTAALSIADNASGSPQSVELDGTGTLGGKALVGQQPLIGASVQLYAMGTSGNGSNGSALLSNALTTDSSGAFSVTEDYDCPSASSQLYLVARGGQPGSAAAPNNDAITLLTVLGACSNVASIGPVVINEATTAAAVYALAQFLSPGANLGATSTNTVGLNNAVATAQALANISTGTSPGPAFAAPSFNGSSPAPEINTLANLLNACASSTDSGSACTGLFGATATSGGTPDNTLDAALNLVRNPAENVVTLYNLASASSAFTPALTAQPSDWTLFINYTGGGMDQPTALGVDGAGNVWVANYLGGVASLFSPLGAPLVANGIRGSGLSSSFGLAVDQNNDAWITNYDTLGSVSVFNSSGASAAGSSGYSTGAGTFPDGVAIDTDGSAWVVDYGNGEMTHLSSSGQQLSGSPYSSSQLESPEFDAIDTSHNVWVSNEGYTTVTRVNQAGNQFTSYDCCDSPQGLAIDQSGNVWVPNYYGDSVSEISGTGTVLSKEGITGGGLDYPDYIAIDGAGTVWISNYRGPSLTELAGSTSSTPGTALSPAGGLGKDAGLLEAYALAIDASGNLWVSNRDSNILTEFIGLAAPVRTPQIGPSAAP